MNWVAIDIGSSEVKASVLDMKNTPVRLNYSMGGYYTTRLSSDVVITTSGEIIVGDDAMLLGVMNPSLLVSDWQHHSRKEDICKTLLSLVYNAAKRHYDNDVIGVVVLYERVKDECLIKTCEQIFAETKPIESSMVFVKAMPRLKSGVTVIADFGAQNFKVSILEDGAQKSFTCNSDFGFRNLDLEFLIDSVQWDVLTDAEFSLYGILIQRVKVALNSGDSVVLPYETKIKGCAISNEYEKCMTTFLYQCFEECSNSLRACSKAWGDVMNILFVGGGANSSIINGVFERYMQRQGCTLKSYNTIETLFDPPYAATHMAFRLPLRQKTDVIIKY